MARPRSAEATIKGFNYQFDATIKILLNSNPDASVVLEGIEDVDVAARGTVMAVQCKYFEGTSLTNSTLRKIVEPMLTDDKSRRPKIEYHIYGFFKDKKEFPLKDAARFRSEVLTYKKHTKAGVTTKNLGSDLDLSDEDLRSFLGRLNFVYTKKYAAHKEGVLEALRREFSCSRDEAKNFFYPNAFSAVAELATKKAISERTISKLDFLALINTRQILFHHWTVREKGESEYCKMMRRSFFSQANTSPYARFFIIECEGSEEVSTLKRILLEVRRRWSSHQKRRLSPRDRYAPYILLRNIAPSKLAQLKCELFAEAIKFVDGYPFLGSPFAPDHIHQEQTVDNQISLRLIESEIDLSSAIDSITNRTREVYQFYNSTPIQLSAPVMHVQIPTPTLSMVPNIL